MVSPLAALTRLTSSNAFSGILAKMVFLTSLLPTNSVRLISNREFSSTVRVSRKRRPPGPSPDTVQKLFRRLRRGPFWVGDWRSTEIGSYGTTNKAIQFLLSHGLISKRREGHKILYEVVQNPPFPFMASDWWPFLTSDRERKELGVIDGETKKWVNEILSVVGFRFRVWGRIGSLAKDSEPVVIDISRREVIGYIERMNSDLSSEETLEKYELVRDFHLCPLCVKDRKREVFTISDSETGEIICGECGLIISRDEIQRTIENVSSAFYPPE